MDLKTPYWLIKDPNFVDQGSKLSISLCDLANILRSIRVNRGKKNKTKKNKHKLIKYNFTFFFVKMHKYCVLL